MMSEFLGVHIEDWMREDAEECGLTIEEFMSEYIVPEGSRPSVNLSINFAAFGQGASAPRWVPAFRPQPAPTPSHPWRNARGPAVEGKKFGIEVEMEGKGLSRLKIAGWNNVPDGSLRGHLLGGESTEFVLREPSTKANCLKHLRRLNVTLKHRAEEVFITPSTSIHVHVNVQHLPVQSIVNMCFLSYLLEPFLFGDCDASRRGNFYCTSWKSTPVVLQMVSSFRKTSSLTEIREVFGKYSWLNLRALHDLGTLEYRYMDGEFSYERVAKHLDVLDLVRELSCKEGMSSPNLKTAAHIVLNRFNRLRGKLTPEAIETILNERMLDIELAEFSTQ